MKSNLKSLFQKYYRLGIIIDTNILLLAVIGRVDRDLIVKFQRTAIFTPNDYDLLVNPVLM